MLSIISLYNWLHESRYCSSVFECLVKISVLSEENNKQETLWTQISEQAKANIIIYETEGFKNLLKKLFNISPLDYVISQVARLNEKN